MTDPDTTRHNPTVDLSDRQLTAIATLVASGTQTDAANAAGVTRQTVNQWVNHHYGFIAEVNRLRAERLQTCADRLQDAVGKALELVTEHIEQGDISIATGLLKLVGVDPGDGSGTNMMDIASREWSPIALDATAPDLTDKLLPIAPSGQAIGTISHYFMGRYGFTKDCLVLPFSGDNPSSLIGLGLVTPGQVALSLGTSDTLFACMDQPRTSKTGEGAVFASPDGEHYMALTCYLNGSLAREAVRDIYHFDWGSFAEALRITVPGNNSGLMLPYFSPEIVPKVSEPSVVRQNLNEADAKANIRAVIEAQALSSSIHARWMGVDISSLYVTGGAGLWRSADGGGSWENTFSSGSEYGGYPDQLVFKPSNPSEMVVTAGAKGPGKWREEGIANSRISRSVDGGATWEVATGGLPDYLPHAIEAMSLEEAGGVVQIFVATTSGEVLWSDDAGASWSTAVDGLAPITKGEHYRGLAEAAAR